MFDGQCFQTDEDSRDSGFLVAMLGKAARASAPHGRAAGPAAPVRGSREEGREGPAALRVTQLSPKCAVTQKRRALRAPRAPGMLSQEGFAKE